MIESIVAWIRSLFATYQIEEPPYYDENDSHRTFYQPTTTDEEGVC